MGVHSESKRQMATDVLNVGDVVSLVYTKDRRFQVLEIAGKSVRLRALDEKDPDFLEPIPNIIVDLDDGA